MVCYEREVLTMGAGRLRWWRLLCGKEQWQEGPRVLSQSPGNGTKLRERVRVRQDNGLREAIRKRRGGGLRG